MQTLASISVHLRESLPIISPKAHGVPRSAHDGGDTNKWLEENKDLGHIQAAGMEVAKSKATCHKSLMKVLDEEENFCFRV